MLSVAAAQLSVTDDAVTAPAVGVPGAVGGVVSVPPEVPTVTTKVVMLCAGRVADRVPPARLGPLRVARVLLASVT